MDDNRRGELDPIAGDHDETLSRRCVVGTIINKNHHLSDHRSGSLAVGSSLLTLVAGASFGISRSGEYEAQAGFVLARVYYFSLG